MRINFEGNEIDDLLREKILADFGIEVVGRGTFRIEENGELVWWIDVPTKKED
jgi:hypothetical protein